MSAIQQISTLTIFLAAQPDAPVHGFRDDNGDLHVGNYFGAGSRVLQPGEVDHTAGECAIHDYQPLPISPEELRRENRVLLAGFVLFLIAVVLRFGTPATASAAAFIAPAPTATTAIRG